MDIDRKKFKKKIIFASLKEINDFLKSEGFEDTKCNYNGYKSIEDFMECMPTLYNYHRDSYFYSSNKIGNVQLILDMGSIENSIKNYKLKTEFIEQKRKEARISYKRIAAHLDNITEKELKRIVNNEQKSTLSFKDTRILAAFIGAYNIRDIIEL